MLSQSSWLLSGLEMFVGWLPCFISALPWATWLRSTKHVDTGDHSSRTILGHVSLAVLKRTASLLWWLSFRCHSHFLLDSICCLFHSGLLDFPYFLHFDLCFFLKKHFFCSLYHHECFGQFTYAPTSLTDQLSCLEYWPHIQIPISQIWNFDQCRKWYK